MTTITARPPRAAATAGESSPDFRPDIQGLRALAVGLVVIFHLWPNRLSGGFVGVDVFFVISGYLITAHMLREVQVAGSLSLTRFWARRIRRLLPASYLVLLTSLLSVVVLVPSTLWTATARQIMASALYIQNWALVRDSVTYMARDTPPTVVEHYWSLSVEEQFYLAWPILVVTILATRRMSRRRQEDERSPTVASALLIGMSVVCASSLAYSVIATYANPDPAYFSTFTRAWEFGAGAMLAGLVAQGRSLLGRWAVVGGWLGVVAVLWSALAIDNDSFFPGWVAIFPVAGTALVMSSSAVSVRWSASRLLSVRPLTYVGDVSYSVYLWHWPLIVLVPYVTGVPLRTGDKLVILVATLGLSAASKAFVEDRFRRGRLLAAAPWRAFGFALAGILVIGATTTAVHHEIDSRAAATQEATKRLLNGQRTSGCLGPAALDPANGCQHAAGNGSFVPSIEAVSKQRTHGLSPQCQTPLGSRTVKECMLGAKLEPRREVAIVGDSHATMWLPAFEQLGKDRNWTVHVYSKASCPLTLADRVLDAEKTTEERDNCRAWVAQVVRDLRAHPEIREVYTTAFSSAYGWSAPADAQLSDPRSDGFVRLWRELEASGKSVRVIHDVPRTTGQDVPTCLATHESHRTACAVPRQQALRPDALADAARSMTDVPIIDFTDQFCDARLCYPVIGNAIAYMDTSHLSTTYSRALAPYLEAQIDAFAVR